jgi:hypothetical protein
MCTARPEAASRPEPGLQKPRCTKLSLRLALDGPWLRLQLCGDQTMQWYGLLLKGSTVLWHDDSDGSKEPATLPTTPNCSGVCNIHNNPNNGNTTGLLDLLPPPSPKDVHAQT